MPPIPPLTLIVATTPSLGIGLRGSLPWPPLKSDLAFFARVTKRPPPPSIHPDTAGPENGAPRAINAVIMGRKTWDSIPSKFRPLKGRVNVVISRNAAVLESLGRLDAGVSTDTMGVEDIPSAVQALHSRYGSKDSPLGLGRVFVIGGASIYEQAMSMDSCERILWTRIHKEYECDVHFPGQGNLGNHNDAGAPGPSMWEQKSMQDLREWCGDQSIGEVQSQGDTHFEIQMWERSSVEKKGH